MLAVPVARSKNSILTPLYLVSSMSHLLGSNYDNAASAYAHVKVQSLFTPALSSFPCTQRATTCNRRGMFPSSIRVSRFLG